MTLDLDTFLVALYTIVGDLLAPASTEEAGWAKPSSAGGTTVSSGPGGRITGGGATGRRRYGAAATP